MSLISEKWSTPVKNVQSAPPSGRDQLISESPAQSIRGKGKTAVHLSKARRVRQLVFFGFENSGSEARSWARELRFKGSKLGSDMEKLGSRLQRSAYSITHFYRTRAQRALASVRMMEVHLFTQRVHKNVKKPKDCYTDHIIILLNFIFTGLQRLPNHARFKH